VLHMTASPITRRLERSRCRELAATACLFAAPPAQGKAFCGMLYCCTEVVEAMARRSKKTASRASDILPTAGELLRELDGLIRAYEALQAKYPNAQRETSEGPHPLKSPLSPRWRPYASEPPATGVKQEVIEWTNALRQHLARLERYFYDRPDGLKRFPLYPFLQGWMHLSGDEVAAALQKHKDLLRIETHKAGELDRDLLPRDLREARKKQGLTQLEAAERLKVSVHTYKAWESGKNFPRATNHSQIWKFLRGSL
jgi:DNA-binding transcriptional regulator YiaG